MRIKNITVSNSRLIEGSYHTFKILKVADFGDSDTFFVMQDPLGYKVLMPAGFYTRYGFEPGLNIECRVDRINCNGRMFLEPMHPYYKESCQYDFGVAGKGKQMSITGDDEYYITVRDTLGQDWKVKIHSGEYLDTISDSINCKIERIKKGRLYLSPSFAEHVKGALENGGKYEFTIVDEKINPADGHRYFIVESPGFGKQLIRKKFYLHYALKVGQKISCRVDSFTSEGYYFLEPENPWYKEGEVYGFKPLEIHKLHFSDGTVQDVLVLDDPHSEPLKVFIDSADPELWKDTNSVACKVTGFRKGRPELLII